MGSLSKTELSIKTKAINEPRHEKNLLLFFCICENKGADPSCALPFRAVNTFIEKKMDHMQEIKRSYFRKDSQMLLAVTAKEV